jgi:CheY-like chemotaxis protein
VARPDLAGISVLVVDDEADARDVVGAILSSYGAEVRTASSVALALDAIRERPPLVVVSDIGMPGEDGFALIAQLRALTPPLASLPVIALTAYARRDDARRMLTAGFRRFLSKPADPITLATAVRDLARPD